MRSLQISSPLFVMGDITGFSCLICLFGGTASPCSIYGRTIGMAHGLNEGNLLFCILSLCGIRSYRTLRVHFQNTRYALAVGAGHSYFSTELSLGKLSFT